MRPNKIFLTENAERRGQKIRQKANSLLFNFVIQYERPCRKHYSPDIKIVYQIDIRIEWGEYMQKINSK
jgi:hypothetical protein